MQKPSSRRGLNYQQQRTEDLFKGGFLNKDCCCCANKLGAGRDVTVKQLKGTAGKRKALKTLLGLLESEISADAFSMVILSLSFGPYTLSAPVHSILYRSYKVINGDDFLVPYLVTQQMDPG